MMTGSAFSALELDSEGEDDPVELLTAAEAIEVALSSELLGLAARSSSSASVGADCRR
jgi:hypothetical protein